MLLSILKISLFSESSLTRPFKIKSKTNCTFHWSLRFSVWFWFQDTQSIYVLHNITLHSCNTEGLIFSWLLFLALSLRKICQPQSYERNLINSKCARLVGWWFKLNGRAFTISLGWVLFSDKKIRATNQNLYIRCNERVFFFSLAQ